MIQVRDIQTDGNDRSDKAHGSGLHQVLIVFPLDTLDEIGNDHRSHDEQIVIGHLHVVGIYFKGGEDGCDDKAPQVFPPVGQHDTRYHRRQIGQGHHLPDMSCSNDNEEITAERPYHRTQHGQIPTEIEGTQQDIEA